MDTRFHSDSDNMRDRGHCHFVVFNSPCKVTIVPEEKELSSFCLLLGVHLHTNALKAKNKKSFLFIHIDTHPQRVM